MIKYKSTRGNSKLYTFSECILKGISSDEGLFVPQDIPQIKLKDLKFLVQKSYQEQAVFVFNLFQTDFTKKKIKEIVNKAYSENFANSDIISVSPLKKNQYILELWHGPTAAFKDLALQIMPLFFSEAAIKNNLKRLKEGKKPLKYLILTATSGDTGKAALEGYKNRENISLIVFYPEGHVSPLQELQMVTQEGRNVKVYAVKADFDATQRLVKEIFSNREFEELLSERFKIAITSANSINWGRLIPQIVYHIAGYLDLVEKQVINFGEIIDIAVPSGNFGNLLAAYYAKQMGLPIRKLICASNENKVLSEFFRTGVYDISKRKLTQTPSPSMDILIASNIERLLYIISNNSASVSHWMNDLKIKGKFEVDKLTKSILKNDFYSDWVSNYDCLMTIKSEFRKTAYLLDPHTAVAVKVANKDRDKKQNQIPTIICSTAHWAKFPDTVYEALFSKKPSKFTEFELIEKIQNLSYSQAPISLLQLKQKRIIHKESLTTENEIVFKSILSFIKRRGQYLINTDFLL